MEPKKNPKADLNAQRGLFFQIGLVLTLGLMLYGFNWSNDEGSGASLGDLKVDDLVEMEVPQTEQKVKPPPPPPPPVLEIVDNEEVLEEEEVTSTEVSQDTRIDIPVIEQEVEAEAEEPEIFTIVGVYGQEHEVSPIGPREWFAGHCGGNLRGRRARPHQRRTSSPWNRRRVR